MCSRIEQPVCDSFFMLHLSFLTTIQTRKRLINDKVHFNALALRTSTSVPQRTPALFSAVWMQQSLMAAWHHGQKGFKFNATNKVKRHKIRLVFKGLGSFHACKKSFYQWISTSKHLLDDFGLVFLFWHLHWDNQNLPFRIITIVF